MGRFNLKPWKTLAHGLRPRPGLGATACARHPQDAVWTGVTVSSRQLAQIRPDRDLFDEVCFTPSRVPYSLPPGHATRLDSTGRPAADVAAPDERKMKLGRTLQILQRRLPSLLASPLPQEILSPHITLQLFPSTHPHLPSASGRVAYHAALWTAPVAWRRVPIVGNVRLDILSERIIRGSHYDQPYSSRDSLEDRLIVKWRTCGKTQGKGMGALYRGIGASDRVDKITEWLGGDARDDEEFTGLFIFEFDEEGRILTQTIEHAEEGRLWEQKTSTVVSVTDWLLGKVNGHHQPQPAADIGRQEPELAYLYPQQRYSHNSHMRRV